MSSTSCLLSLDHLLLPLNACATDFHTSLKLLANLTESERDSFTREECKSLNEFITNVNNFVSSARDVMLQLAGILGAIRNMGGVLYDDVVMRAAGEDGSIASLKKHADKLQSSVDEHVNAVFLRLSTSSSSSYFFLRCELYPCR